MLFFRNRPSLLCIPLFAANLLSAQPTFHASNGTLSLLTPRWSLSLNATTGAIQTLEDRSAPGTLLRGGPLLWSLNRHNAPPLTSANCSFQHSWDAKHKVLTLDFDAPAAAVSLTCTALDNGPAWRSTVRMKQGTLLAWNFPEALEFEAATLHQFVFPDNLGIAFTPAFFQSGGGGLKRHPLGPKGLELVANFRCQMRPMNDPPVPLSPGRDAKDWLPAWLLKEAANRTVTANRCPAKIPCDISLLETPNGSWLSGHRLGGWGTLFLLGGAPQNSDFHVLLHSILSILTKVHSTPPTDGTEVKVPAELAGVPPLHRPDPPRQIGVIFGQPTARPGTLLFSASSRWLAELPRQKWLADSGLEIVPLRTPAEIRTALARPRQWFAIVNTLGESFPVEDPGRSADMLAAIRDYVRNGGLWFEAGGGYPFYHAIARGGDASFTSENRAFCDFVALDSANGRWSLFGIQAPEAIFCQRRSEISAQGPDDHRTGRYRHSFEAWAKPGESWQSPEQQMTIGIPHREALRLYAKLNQFEKTLADKAKPGLIDRLKRSLLLKVSTKTLEQTTRVAETLQYPVLFHIAEYLHGGFDKQYPDHLPPNPAVGTPEDLSRLIQMCRDKGHLFMPYTNPTWWCTNPKGPTFERVGDTPLSRDFEGNIYPERYGEARETQGYTVCAWHPEVRKANDIILEQFTKEYPSDVLFQDQIGARHGEYDTNPTAPHPAAYLEGIHRIAQHDCKTVPLGTEDGHDRLINYETMFTGLSWTWLPNRATARHVLYEHVWPDGAWRHEPLALFLAHDKVLFYHHDLGGFIRDRLDISLSLAMGYGLSWWTTTPDPAPAERDWIDRLCRLQAAIGPRLAGQPLDDFQYLSPNVIQSRWNGLTVTANLGEEPWQLDSDNTIAPLGFHAAAPGFTAGILTRHAGKNLDPAGTWILRDGNSPPWTAGPESPPR